MATKVDKQQTTLVVDGKQAINKLGKLEMQYKEVSAAIKGMKKSHKDYDRLAGNQSKIQAEIKKTRDELGIQGMTLTQLVRHEQELKRTRSNTTTQGTAEYKRLNAEIKRVSAAVRQQRMEATNMGGVWSKIGKEVKQFGLLAISYLGVTALTGKIDQLIRKTGEYSDLLASVQKTTGLTKQEVEELNESLSKIDTRTARKEMLAMAKVAGKLGITAKNDVEGFVRAFDKINVALGEDLGNPEEVARKLGKLMESFRINDTYDIETGLLKVGSAINHLGKSSTANEGYIVEFTRRMAGIAPLANLSIQDVMGLGATLDALGQTSEVSSTSLNKLFIKMTQNGEVFAKYAKTADGATLSTDQFAQLIETDFNEAFISLLRGVRDNSEGMSALSETLGDLELDGGRVIGVLGSLANNQDLLAEQQKISNTEFEKGTSVLAEFNLMNETAGAKIDKLQRAFSQFLMSSGLVQFIERSINSLASFLPVAESAQSKIKGVTSAINLELNALKTVNVSSEQRSRIIQSINDKYGSYLPNLINEKASLEDIVALQEELNRQSMAKVLMMNYEEEIAAIQRERYEAEENLWTIEQQRAKLAADTKLDPQALAFQRQQLENSEALNREMIESAPEMLAAAKEKFTKIAASMGEDFDELMSKLRGGGKKKKVKDPDDEDDDPSGLDDVLGDEESQQEKINGYISRLEDGFTQERTALARKYADGLISEQEYNMQLEELELNHLNFMRGLRKELGLSTIDIEEKIYQKQIELMKKRQGAERSDADKSKQLLRERQDAFRQLGASIGQMFGTISQMQNEQTQSGIRNAAAFANAQVIASNVVVAANQIESLSEAIKGGTKAGASTGASAGIMIPVYITALMATVLGAFASIKSNNSNARSQLSSLRESQSNSSGRSYYDGGFVGMDSGSGGDFYGRFSGYSTHEGEYVVPSYRMSDPQTIDAVKVIEARRQGYSLGGGGQSMNVNSTLDAKEFREGVAMFKSVIDVLTKKGIPSYFTPYERERSDEYEADKQSARRRGSLS